MIVAVLGADTKIGQSLVEKAEREGIKTLSIVSSYTSLSGEGRVLIKSIDDLTVSDFHGCHAVIDPLSFFKIASYSSDFLPLWHMLEVLKDSKISLLTLGSPAILYTDKTRRHFVCHEDGSEIDGSSRDDLLCLNAFKRLKECINVSWSVLCPPLLTDETGYGSGVYEFSDDILPVGTGGESIITLNDYLSSCIELLKRGLPRHKVVSVRAV
ncbi:MAG: hypothetical protein ACI4NE_08830 [Succinivibrio sp.]